MDLSKFIRGAGEDKVSLKLRKRMQEDGHSEETIAAAIANAREFVDGAESLGVSVEDTGFSLPPTAFGPGSLGWYGAQTVRIGGVDCRVAVTVTVAGTKPPKPAKAKATPRKA